MHSYPHKTIRILCIVNVANAFIPTNNLKHLIDVSIGGYYGWSGYEKLINEYCTEI